MPLPQPTDELIRRHDVPGPRYTSYPTVPEWSPLDPEEYARRLQSAGDAGPASPFSLYVHIPFCDRLCTYCGCNVVVTRDRGRADKYLEHLEREMDLAAARLGPRHWMSQVHWGGGTPNFLSEAQISRLWEAITARFTPTPDAEVSVEVNPKNCTFEQLALLRRLGFNRISMGVQDLDPEVQQAIGRVQGPAQTRALLELARELGFGGVNFDLIYGLPHQEPARWQRTLDQVLAMRPDRVAVYSFAFVPDLRPQQRKLPVAALPRGRDKLDLFLQAHRAFTSAGYQQIGMDHFALPEDELARAQRARKLGRNFQGYTVVAAADAVALGISGISDVAGVYAQNVHPLPSYYQALGAGRFATERGLVLSEDDRRRRAVINALMCNFWVDLGPDGRAYFARELEELRPLEQDGLVRTDGAQVEVTLLGRLFVRNVAMVFDAYLQRPAGARTFSRTV